MTYSINDYDIVLCYNDIKNDQFKNSKEWKFSLYYLEELIVSSLTLVSHNVKKLKKNQINVPFEMRYIRETRGSKTLIEQQQMIISFVSNICKKGTYSKSVK